MKKLLLSFALFLCLLSPATAQTITPEINKSGPIVSLNYTFAGSDISMYGLTFAYEHKTFDLVSFGGGLGFHLAFTDVGSSSLIGAFNPFGRAKVNFLRKPTTPFFIFDVGYYGSESGLSEDSPVDGVSLTPTVGIDIGTGGSAKIRVTAGMLCVIGVGKTKGDDFGYGRFKMDKGDSSNFVVSVGCKF